MKTLSKAQSATRTELVERLNRAKEKVQEAFVMVQEAIDNHVNLAINEYNEIVAEAEEFRDELVGDMESYADDRSEKWAESEAGSDFNSWKDEWEGWDATQLDEVAAPDEPDMAHPDELEALPEDVG